LQSGRYPYDSFPYLKSLLGASADATHDILFPSLIHPSNRSIEFTLGSAPQTHYSVEELVGMQFAYARELGEHMAGEKIGEAVIVVPGWWGQAERQAVKDAAEIGGLRSVDLINDATASASCLPGTHRAHRATRD
jgi:hypoxia up-regulated 1